ncbi:MAG: succinate dehydrogenase assembly factor 2 [Marinagarivorans sp.]|nr:succinate dehydrogenase assembly factor 2 [Marinagarivorans sp.]
MEYNRLKWACRRGMLELDLILMPFLENVYLTLPSDEQALFTALLAEEDQDLFGWLMKHKDAPTPQLQKIVAIILAHTGLQA